MCLPNLKAVRIRPLMRFVLLNQEECACADGPAPGQPEWVRYTHHNSAPSIGRDGVGIRAWLPLTRPALVRGRAMIDWTQINARVVRGGGALACSRRVDTRASPERNIRRVPVATMSSANPLKQILCGTESLAGGSCRSRNVCARGFEQLRSGDVRDVRCAVGLFKPAAPDDEDDDGRRLRRRRRLRGMAATRDAGLSGRCADL